MVGSLDQQLAQQSHQSIEQYVLLPETSYEKKFSVFGNMLFEPRLEIVTLGRGQEHAAESAIERCRQDGGWIVLQVDK